MLHVLTKDGKKLFSGTKREVKQFIRKNALTNYVLKERFVETIPAAPAKKEYPQGSSFDTNTEEGQFNEIFNE